MSAATWYYMLVEIDEFFTPSAAQRHSTTVAMVADLENVPSAPAVSAGGQPARALPCVTIAAISAHIADTSSLQVWEGGCEDKCRAPRRRATLGTWESASHGSEEIPYKEGG